MPDVAFPLFEIIAMVACVFSSAFFSGSETALTNMSDQRIGHLIEHDPGRFGILKFWTDNKRRILAALLVGNNLVNIFCSVLAFKVAFYFLPNYAEALSVFGLTFIILVFAEITPKSLALHYCEQVAVPVLRVVWLVDKILWLITVPLSRIPQLLLRKSGDISMGTSVTEDEIEYQIRLGHDQAVFEEKEQGKLLMSVVEFSEMTVKDAMIPRTDIFGLEMTTPFDQAVEAVIAKGHSRIPVYHENLDQIVGLLYAKDLINYLAKGDSSSVSTVESLIRKPPAKEFFAPETQKLSDLLTQMRRRRRHMAIAVDEFGGTAGVITLEDIIEELVGEIRDEYDNEDAMVHRINEMTWLVDARLPIHDLKDITGIELADSGEYESVGGFVVAQYGSIPVTGTVVQIPLISIKVIASNARHVERLEFSCETPDEKSDE